MFSILVATPYSPFLVWYNQSSVWEESSKWCLSNFRSLYFYACFTSLLKIMGITIESNRLTNKIECSHICLTVRVTGIVSNCQGFDTNVILRIYNLRRIYLLTFNTLITRLIFITSVIFHKYQSRRISVETDSSTNDKWMKYN